MDPGKAGAEGGDRLVRRSLGEGGQDTKSINAYSAL